MLKHVLLLAGLALPPALSAQQTNILSTNALAEQILLGNYNPADYAPAAANPAPATLAALLNFRVSPDSLQTSILRLSTFGNRNSGSDTLSASTGIGAARRWTYQQFKEIGAANNGRLVASYLQFDQVICAVGQHRDIFAVLPGTDPSHNGVILVEGHIDSRCAVLCDTACVAEGIEDNATGTALVLELARVMSKFSYPNTIVFVVTIAEEQGLFGAAAFAQYIQQKNIPLRAVFNNDVIGGIICGKTSSPPSCPGLNEIDSTSVRMFSLGGFNSLHKQ
ncbi:MAG: M28 family peptidase, partial [Saprospiraceae bacterium]